MTAQLHAQTRLEDGLGRARMLISSDIRCEYGSLHTGVLLNVAFPQLLQLQHQAIIVFLVTLQGRQQLVR